MGWAAMMRLAASQTTGYNVLRYTQCRNIVAQIRSAWHWLRRVYRHAYKRICRIAWLRTPSCGRELGYTQSSGPHRLVYRSCMAPNLRGQISAGEKVSPVPIFAWLPAEKPGYYVECSATIIIRAGFTWLRGGRSHTTANETHELFNMADQEETTAIHGPSLSILALAQDILERTQDMTRFFQANNLNPPTFALGSEEPPNSPEYRHLYGGLKNSLEDLLRLIDGPSRWLRTFCCTGYDLGALQIALDFDFFHHVPALGDISLEELAEKSVLDLDRTSRVVRQLRTYRIFEELRPRAISHSSASLVMRQDDDLRSVVHYSLDEMLKAAADCNVSLRANPHEAHQNLNPFVTRHGVGIFEFYENDPAKARRFAKAMAGLRKMDRHLDYLLNHSFDWSAISGTVVDCGGGNGHISCTLAQVCPQLRETLCESMPDFGMP